jgi:hypothetical protein
METLTSGNSGRSRTLLILMLFTLVSLAANGAKSPSPVFVKAACDGKISSAVISTLREEIGNSQKYRLVRTVADNGQMDVVLTIEVNCTERNKLAAIATIFGRAKCFGVKNCHLAIDGSSLRSDLCDSDGVTECVRTLFRAFDDNVSNPLAPPL